MREVRVEDVEVSLAAMVDQAARGEATIVTRRGAPVALVLG